MISVHIGFRGLFYTGAGVLNSTSSALFLAPIMLAATRIHPIFCNIQPPSEI